MAVGDSPCPLVGGIIGRGRPDAGFRGPKAHPMTQPRATPWETNRGNPARVGPTGQRISRRIVGPLARRTGFCGVRTPCTNGGIRPLLGAGFLRGGLNFGLKQGVIKGTLRTFVVRLRGEMGQDGWSREFVIAL